MRKKIDKYDIFRFELFYLSSIMCIFSFFLIFYSVNFSFSGLTIPLGNPKLIKVKEISVKSSSGRGGNWVLFNYQGNEYRAPCYIEVTEHLCGGENRVLQNIIFLEPYTNARDVLIVSGQLNQNAFFIPKERQSSFYKQSIFEMYFTFIVGFFSFFYLLLFLTFRRK